MRRRGRWQGSVTRARYGLGFPRGSLSVPVSEACDGGVSDNQIDSARPPSPMAIQTSGRHATEAATKTSCSQDAGTANAQNILHFSEALNNITISSWKGNGMTETSSELRQGTIGPVGSDTLGLSEVHLQGKDLFISR